jgi:hypothetical protein
LLLYGIIILFDLSTKTSIKSLAMTDQDSNKVEEATQFHFLPCSVKYNGPAPVAAYFKVNVGKRAGELESAFRGRELKVCVYGRTQTKGRYGTSFDLI